MLVGCFPHYRDPQSVSDLTATVWTGIVTDTALSALSIISQCNGKLHTLIDILFVVTLLYIVSIY